ncbi:DUF368 domain-containing protein [Haladaptatus sp. GCM10025893]|uniref:DUF368 domain-containing protein n=1 Tax=Haladaptatus sp. GCM10025893 TaxID=3252659 RepID=UPI0036230322
MDAGFVLVLGAGMATAIVVVTRLVHHASEAYPALLYGFFFGLIAASALILLRTLRIQTPVQAAAGGLGFILAFMLSGTPALLGGGGLGTVFIAGAVAVSAMILPGISGSLLLVILGQYTRMATSLSGFIDALIAVLLGGSLARLTEPGVEVLVFVLGGFTGLVSVSRLIRWALAAHRRGTLAFLVMMVVGALRAPVARVAETVGFSPAIGVVFVGSAVVGVGIVLVLDWYVVDLDFDSL